MSADINVSVLLKRFLSFAIKTDPEFCILLLGGGNQSIAYTNVIPTMIEGIDLCLQHKMVKDSQPLLGIVDARIIRVFLQANPTLTF
jgi:hypothetical protein